MKVGDLKWLWGLEERAMQYKILKIETSDFHNNHKMYHIDMECIENSKPCHMNCVILETQFFDSEEECKYFHNLDINTQGEPIVNIINSMKVPKRYFKLKNILNEEG